MRNTYPLTLKLCLLISFSALFGAYALEYWQNIEPCPLCMAQRVLMIGIFLVTLLGLLHRPKSAGIRFYSFLTLLVAGAGLALACRHVSLYRLPSPQLSSCVGSLSYLFETLPLKEALAALWKGGAECTADTSRWLSLTIPEWAMMSFAVITILGLVTLIRGR